MFSAQNTARLRLFQSRLSLTQVQHRELGIFDYFRRKKPEEDVKVEEEATTKPEVQVPKEKKAPVSTTPKIGDLKQEIRDLDRTQEGNLYTRY